MEPNKVAVNTAAVKNPKLINELVKKFGSQSIVISIEAKHTSDNKWEVFIENGRERTGLDVVMVQCESLGAGEILLTSIDKEGTGKGFDIELLKNVQKVINIPLIASGGMGKPKDLLEIVMSLNVNAVSMANIIHYNKFSIKNIKDFAQNNIAVRNNMNKKITVIDYGVGNLLSLKRAFEKIDADVTITNNYREIINSSSVVLPGVGAFENAMKAIKNLNVIEPIKIIAEKGVPLLGICLGAQLLLSKSEEFGITKGIDIIKGEVKNIKTYNLNKQKL